MSALRSVLVIDDEKDFRDTLQGILAREQLDVTAVGSGNAAVEVARQRRFDLVVTDLAMPGMSGTETISAIKEIDPHVPVVVVTGYASDEVSAECFARGAKHFVRKPFNLPEFIGLVMRTLE